MNFQFGPIDARLGSRPERANPVIIRGWPWYFKLLDDRIGLYDKEATLTNERFLVTYQPGQLPGEVEPFLTRNGEPGWLYSSFHSELAFYRYLKTVPAAEQAFHEVIPDCSQRLRFDIDDFTPERLFELNHRTDLAEAAYEAVLQLMDAVAGCLRELGLDYRPARDVLVCSSNSSQKQSYHLIYNGFYHLNARDAKHFAKLVVARLEARGQGWLVPYLDLGIYHRNVNFRLLGSAKPGSDRVKVIDRRFDLEWDVRYKQPKLRPLLAYQRSLISRVAGSVLIPYYAPVIERPIRTTTDESLCERAVGLMQRVLADAPFEIKEINEGIVSLTRLAPSLCPICDVVHEHENPYLIVNAAGQVRWHCRRTNHPPKYLGSLNPGNSETQPVVRDWHADSPTPGPEPNHPKVTKPKLRDLRPKLKLPTGTHGTTASPRYQADLALRLGATRSH